MVQPVQGEPEAVAFANTRRRPWDCFHKSSQITALLQFVMLVVILHLCGLLDRAGAQLTADSAPPGLFRFYGDRWNGLHGGECKGSECQQYACTDRPEKPYCRGCSGLAGIVWNIDPEDCLEEADTPDNERCSKCKMQCRPYSTGWRTETPVPGLPAEPWTCKVSGKKCAGPCDPAWQGGCDPDYVFDPGCDCRAGSFRCIGERKNNMLECDIQRCDPASSSYDRKRCACSKTADGSLQTVGGLCTWIDSPVVMRDMGLQMEGKKCLGFNYGDTSVSPVAACDEGCGREQGLCLGSTEEGEPAKGIAVCSTDSWGMCRRTCLLDRGCVGVTWDPPPKSGGNNTRTGRCYKVNTGCIPVDSATGEEVWFKVVDWQWPGECLPRQQVQEDTIRFTKLDFHHDKTGCRTCPGVEVTLLVNYGSLNIGQPDNSLKCIDPNYDQRIHGNPPRARTCNVWSQAAEDRFRFNCPSWPASHDQGDGCGGIALAPDVPLPDVQVQFLPQCPGEAPPAGCGKATTFPGIVLKGPYQQVLEALHSVTYVPADDQNSQRLRSRIYSGSSSRSSAWPMAKPYEELTISVWFPPCVAAGPDAEECPCHQCGYAGYPESMVRRYLLHILPMNDAPVLVNPADTYVRPSYCDPTPDLEDCLDSGQPLSQEECHRCHFGPFWAYEGDSETVVQVKGLQVTDEDVLESCAWTEQKCTSLDMQVLSLYGSLDINTRLGLAIYKDQSSSKGFTGPLKNTAAAVTMLKYRSPSTAYNTHHSGQVEALKIFVSDQGFEGASGAGRIPDPAKLDFGSSLAVQTSIDITLVAVNDPPAIHFDVPGGRQGGVLRYNVQEDKLDGLLGVSVTDVDVEQEIQSTLANFLWMNDLELTVYIGKMRVIVQVSTGTLYLPVLSNLQILSTMEAFYLTVSTRYNGHDLCRSRALLMNPVGALGASSYTEVCAVIKEGACTSGEEAECECLKNDDCENGRTLLFIRPVDRLGGEASRQYYVDLQYAIATTSDRTCGGVPYYKSPHLFSTGLDCENDKACQVEDMTPCQDSPGGCLCCANLNVSCTAHSDCDGLQQGSLCGCMWHGPAARDQRVLAQTQGQCGPWLPAESFVAADTDADQVLSRSELQKWRSACKLTPEEASCEEFSVATPPLECLTCRGMACTYRGKGANRCLHPLALSNGTVDSSVVAPLISPPEPGSQLVEFYGKLSDINKALANLQYITANNYNRLSRDSKCYPPPKETSSACLGLPIPFDPTMNYVDQLFVQVDDLGNSGGADRLPQIRSRSIEILPEAVNDRPRIHAAMEATTVEDWPFSFVNPNLVGIAGLALPAPGFYNQFLEDQCTYMQRTDGTLPPIDTNGLPFACGCTRTCAVPVHNQFVMTSCLCNNNDCSIQCASLQKSKLTTLLTKELINIRGRTGPGIFISDPDYLDFGFQFLTFEVNVSVQHGRLLLNEAFLSQKDVFDVRVKVVNYEPMSAPQEMQTSGLYHKAPPGDTNCAHCIPGWHWINQVMQCCDLEEGARCRTCKLWGTGDKFVSIQGSMEDVNLALSNITYINDLDFNTRSGTAEAKEAILIEVSDKGAVGNNFGNDAPLSTLWEIALTVESVNDAPVIARLEPILKQSIADDEKVTDIYVFEERPLNMTLHYIEVDEDQTVVLNHTMLWISDVDAKEAETITESFRSADLANQNREFHCLAGEQTQELDALGSPSCVSNAARTGFVCLGGYKDGCECQDLGDLISCAGGCKCSPTSCCRSNCTRPEVCPARVNGPPLTPPGKLTIEFSSRHGLVSIYPPPGRAMLDLVFYTNTSSKMLSEGGTITPCEFQGECMRLQKSITIEGSLEEIQKMLQQRFLSYVGHKHYFGPDDLKVFASDQGFTDQSYNDVLSATVFIPIKILPVNDAPTITATRNVLKYSKGQICHVDYILEVRAEISGLRCLSLSESAVPPDGDKTREIIAFEDVDVRDRAWGNITVNIKIMAPNGGRLFFNVTNPRILFLQRTDEEDMSITTLQGSIDNINSVMPYLRWDADLSYTGYAPLLISIMDHQNSGGPYCHDEVGDRVCRDFSFACPVASCPPSSISVPDLCIDFAGGSGRSCMEWLKLPNMPHKLWPNVNRLTDLTVDVSVGAEAECQLNEDVNETYKCVACQTHPDGCNWCPSTCGGKGKCMKGTKSPTYDTCATESILTSLTLSVQTYGSCDDGTLGLNLLVPIVVAAVVSGIIVLIIAYFRIWALKRHGGIRCYVRKKLQDLKRFMILMEVMPPDTARWTEFIVSAVALAVVALMLLGLISYPSSVLIQDLYLDTTTIVDMDLDHCTVRFIPTRNYPSPDRDLKVPKIRSFLVKDEQIRLDIDACTNVNHLKIKVVNERDTSIKYVNYRCDFEIIVPEGTVLPGMIIREHASGYPSVVRGGPMDEDTRNFGIRFGPNKLQIYGTYMNVRLENVTAKEMHFDIKDGLILGKDIVTTDPTNMSTFSTVGADIIMTTNRMTSVKIQQDTGNLVCLTAANNSLFVDSRTQKRCAYIDSNAVSSRRGNAQGGIPYFSSSRPVITSSVVEQMQNEEYMATFYARQRRNHKNWTIPEYPPGVMCPDGVTQKKDIPFIPGCTDMSLCRQSDREQCLCRPICDMVEPEGLCFDGVCGVEGTCDTSGKCCRDITRSFSTADLFPKPNQPRDGSAVDPVLYPWVPNKLEQRWSLKSHTGQITVTSLQDLQQQFRVSSYKLRDPKAGVLDQSISIPKPTKDLMDQKFHPAGATSPKEVIYEFSMAGPGLMERQEGSVQWIASLIYLVLDSAILDTLTLGILKPFRSAMEIGFNPSFCPAFIPNDDIAEQDRRLVLVRAKLLEALENYPPGRASKPLPMESSIIYRPNSKGSRLDPTTNRIVEVQPTPKGFKLDPKTNKIVVELLNLEDYQLYWVVLYSSIGLAAVVSTLVIVFLGLQLSAYLKQLRADRLSDATLFDGLNDMMQQQKNMLAHNRHAREGEARVEMSSYEESGPKGGNKKINQRIAHVKAQTDFFFMLESFIDDPESAATPYRRMVWNAQALLVLVLPIIIIWLFSMSWRAAVLEEQCRLRADRTSCLVTRPMGQIETILLLQATLVFALELSAHYLHLSYSTPRRYLRLVFYVEYGACCLAVLVITVLICIWLLLGVLILPSKVLPYAAGLAGVGANAVTIWAKLRCFEYKVSLKPSKRLTDSRFPVRRAVAQRMTCMRPLLRKVPRPLVDSLMRTQLQVVLRMEGLSVPQIAQAVLYQLLLLLLILTFLLIAFASFTDPYNVTNGIFNTVVVSIVCIAFNNSIRSDSNSKAAKDAVFETQDRLSKEILLHLKHVHFQVQAALKLYAQMRDQLRADMDSDQMSHQTESFLSTQGSDEEFEMPEGAESPDVDEDPIEQRMKALDGDDD